MIRAVFGSFSLFYFCLSLFLDGAIGVPTPDHLGVKEGFIFLCLILSLRPRAIVDAPFMVMACLIFWISVPFLAAILNHNASPNMMRDLVAVGFWSLCVFVPLGDPKPVLKIILAAGLALSVRSLIGVYPLFDVLQFLQADAFSYLANSPLVLFTACLLIQKSIDALYKNQIQTALILFALTLLPILAMAGMMQRVSLFGVFCIALYGILSPVARQPRLILPMILLCLGGAALLFLPPIQDQIHLLIQKTQQVGVNNRDAELRAVWASISQSPLSVLFGMGWGASLKSAAVGDVWVNYTHSFLSFLLWKTGIVGLCFALGYMGLILKTLYRLRRDQTMFALSALLPFLIDVFLYASYKSFGFGGLVWVILAMGRAHETKNSIPQ